MTHNGAMRQPIDLPVQPMLAKAVADVPVGPGLAYEPKWDGFRCIVLRDGDDIELASRGTKPLTRYFPEVVEHVRRLLPQRCAVDTEIVVRSGSAGAERLAWERLSQRIHPADSRVRKLSVEPPAELVCVDFLALGDDSLLGMPFAERRARLEVMLGHLAAGDPIHLTKITTDPALARHWFERFEGAGLDGVVAKSSAKSVPSLGVSVVLSRMGGSCQAVVVRAVAAATMASPISAVDRRVVPRSARSDSTAAVTAAARPPRPRWSSNRATERIAAVGSASC